MIKVITRKRLSISPANEDALCTKYSIILIYYCNIVARSSAIK
jgi:hypothetical protein